MNRNKFIHGLRIAGILALGFPAAAMIGCEDNDIDDAEDIGEEIDDAMDDMGDELEDIDDRP